jgi:hypothetical protein
MFPMAYPPYFREKARQLRREQKLTLDELVERLALPRTTIFYWIRDIPIERKPATTWPATAHQAAARSNRRRFRQLREAAYDEGRKEFGRLAKIPLFRDFVCLYIAEGYKRSRNTVSIVNSDPAVVRLGAYWLNAYSANRVRYRLVYHEDQDVGQLRDFWASELGSDAGDVSAYRKSNSGRLGGRRWRCECGLLTVDAYDTLFRARLQAWIDCLQNEWLDSIAVGA